MSGTEEGYTWMLRIDVCRKSRHSQGSFTTTDAEYKRKMNVRRRDANWAEDTFSRQFREKYEIHHEWERGETLYFLTKEEHRLVTARERLL